MQKTENEVLFDEFCDVIKSYSCFVYDSRLQDGDGFGGPLFAQCKMKNAACASGFQRSVSFFDEYANFTISCVRHITVIKHDRCDTYIFYCKQELSDVKKFVILAYR